MAATIQAEVLLPGEDDVPLQQQQFSGGEKIPESPFILGASKEDAFPHAEPIQKNCIIGGEKIPESPFILAASKDGEITHAVTTQSSNMLSMMMNSSNQQHLKSNCNLNDVEKDDLKPKEWDEIGKQVQTKHRKEFSFGITAARQMSEDIMSSSCELPQDVGLPNMLTSRQSNIRKLSPPDMSIDLERATSATDQPPTIPQTTSGIMSSLRALTPTPPPTPDTSSASDRAQPSHSRKISISVGGQVSLQEFAEESSKDPLGKLLLGLSMAKSEGFCPPKIQEDEQESKNTSLSLQSLINNCKKAGNDLVLELCNHPSSSEVVLNAKTELQDVCMRLVQSLGLADTVVKMEHQNNQQEQKQQQSVSWQVEFWKVKYKETAEKYNKLTMYYEKQQQQQQQQQKQQQMQQVSSGINPLAKPWKPQQAISRQSSVASMSAYKPTVMTPLVRTPSGTQQQPQQKDSLRSNVSGNSGGNGNVAIPPDSAILSVNGFVTSPSEVAPKTNIIRNEIPRPDLLRRQKQQNKGIKGDNREKQEKDTVQLAKNAEGQSNKTNRGSRRGKNSSNKNKSKAQQQQQSTQMEKGSSQSKQGRYTSIDDNINDKDKSKMRGPRDNHRGGGGGGRGFISSRNARRGGKSGGNLLNGMQKQNNDTSYSAVQNLVQLNGEVDTQHNNILASIAQMSAQKEASSEQMQNYGKHFRSIDNTIQTEESKERNYVENIMEGQI